MNAASPQASPGSVRSAAFDSLSANIAVVDRDGNIVQVNEAWRHFATNGGSDEGHTGPGVSYLEVCRDATGSFSESAGEVVVGLSQVLSSRLAEFELEYPCPNKTEERWWLLRATPLRPGDGIVVAHMDITHQKRAQARLAVLEEISKLVTTSLDAKTIVQTLGGYAVPRIADFFLADLVEDGTVRRVAIVHADPAKEELAKALAGQARAAPEPPPAVGRVMLTRKAELLSAPEEIVSSVSRPTPSARELGIRSAMTIPLVAHDRVLGALSFASTNPLRKYDSDDLVFAENLAGHVALSIENARLYDSVRAADAAKAEFLALLAHELRNPMTPILNAIELLRLRSNGDRGNSALQIIEHQVLHQARLLDDLLDLAAVDRGGILLRRQTVDFCALVREMVEDHARVLASAGLALEVELPSEPCLVNADPTRLAQIVGNLLSNAVKFSNRGGRVRVYLQKDSVKGSARLSVQDTGIGLDGHRLESIFEPFQQEERSLTRTRGGLGLGLALVRRLAALQGGEVSAHSAGLGKGAEFVMTLPLCAGEALPLERPGEKKKSKGDGMRVLVIEDNRDAADTLRALLEAGGYEALAVYSGPEGLASLRPFQPDVVLCDIGLPGMDGYSVATQIRRDPENARVRLVAVTGFGQATDRERAAQAGFEMQLTKPVRFFEVTRFLERAQAERRAE